MNSDRRTKDCKLCYTQIDARAKVCPVCRYPQAFIKLLIGAAVLWFVLVFAILILSLWYEFPIGGLSQPVSDGNHAARLQVVQSSMQVEEDKDGELTLLVLGKLKNTAEFQLHGIGYEVHVLDAQGELVDMHTDHYDFTVGANDEAPFKCRFPLRPLPRERFASHRVVFKFAEQGEARSRYGY